MRQAVATARALLSDSTRNPRPVSRSIPCTSALYHEHLFDSWIPCQMAATRSTPQVGERVKHLRFGPPSSTRVLGGGKGTPADLQLNDHIPVTFGGTKLP